MAHWSLDTIPWQEFNVSKVEPKLVSLVKAACMVEYNGYDYARYLSQVFADDTDFCEIIRSWAEEEVQHGKALRKWAELADPAFDFDKSFHIFTTGYKLPDVDQSVRGSRCGELIARCIVETGTSSYYTAIRDYTDEPVLQQICGKIAADEFRHYKLFYTTLQEQLKKEKIGALKRLKIALGRITESEDDELAYAYYATHHDGAPYNRKLYINTYLSAAYALYRKRHVDKMVMMLFKAIGFKPYDFVSRGASQLAWGAMQWRSAIARHAQRVSA